MNSEHSIDYTNKPTLQLTGITISHPGRSLNVHLERRKENSGNLLLKYIHKGPKELAKLFKTIQIKTHKQIDLLSGTDLPWETINVLLSTHFPGSVDAYNLQHSDDTPVKYRVNDLNNFITQDKVHWNINSFDAKKASGPNGIKIAMLHETGPNLLYRLTTLYRVSIQLEYIHKCLHTAKVIFIPQPRS